jgi:hypothetical protein
LALSLLGVKLTVVSTSLFPRFQELSTAYAQVYQQVFKYLSYLGAIGAIKINPLQQLNEPKNIYSNLQKYLAWLRRIGVDYAPSLL